VSTRLNLRVGAFLFGLAGLPLMAQGVLGPIGTIIAEQSRTAFSVQGAGARAMGLGGAFIALSDDATAVSFNPAGLAQMVKPEVCLVGRGLNRDVAFQDVQTIAGNRTSLVDDSLITTTRFDPLLLAGTFPLRVGGRTLALQLSLQRLFPLGEGDARDMVERPQDGTPPMKLHQSIDQTGQIDLYSFALAYELSQRILLGFSVNYWRGASALSSTSSNTTGDTTSYVHFEQNSRLEGANYNLGVLWRWPTWSLGITRRTAFHADYTYNAALSSSTHGNMTTPDSTTGLHWPSTNGIGLAFHPTENWLVAMDLTHTSWSETRYMSNRGGLDGVNFFNMNRAGGTADATQFHTGVERLFLLASGNLIPLRLGYSREPQPVSDPITADQRVIQGLSLGTGIKRRSYTFDVAYRYGWDSRRASQFLDVDQILSNAHSKSIGKETLTEHRLDMSFIAQFERGPVQDFLHYLFVGE